MGSLHKRLGLGTMSVLVSLKGTGDAGQLVLAYRDATKTPAALQWIWTQLKSLSTPPNQTVFLLRTSFSG